MHLVPRETLPEPNSQGGFSSIGQMWIQSEQIIMMVFFFSLSCFQIKDRRVKVAVAVVVLRRALSYSSKRWHSLRLLSSHFFFFFFRSFSHRFYFLPFVESSLFLAIPLIVPFYRLERGWFQNFAFHQQIGLYGSVRVFLFSYM